MPKNTLPISIDPVDFGPAMQALSPQRQQFVIGKVIHGLSDAAAAKHAGYAVTPTNSKQAWLLAHDPRVIEASLR